MKLSDFLARRNLPVSTSSKDFFGPWTQTGDLTERKLRSYLAAAAGRFAAYVAHMGLTLDPEATVKFKRALINKDFGVGVWIAVASPNGTETYVANRKVVAHVAG